MRKTLLLVLCLAGLSGCLTLHDAKALVVPVPPGATSVAVESTATSKCYDFFGIMYCRLWLDLHVAGAKPPEPQRSAETIKMGCPPGTEYIDNTCYPIKPTIGY